MPLMRNPASYDNDDVTSNDPRTLTSGRARTAPPWRPEGDDESDDRNTTTKPASGAASSGSTAAASHHPPHPRDLPLVLCQTTEWNDRLSSQLSAVFLRRLRNDFAPAIRQSMRWSLRAMSAAAAGPCFSTQYGFGSSSNRRVVLAVVGAPSVSHSAEAGAGSDFSRVLQDVIEEASKPPHHRHHPCNVSLVRFTSAYDLDRLLLRQSNGRRRTPSSVGVIVVVAASAQAATDLSPLWRERRCDNNDNNVLVAATILINPNAVHDTTTALECVPHGLLLFIDPNLPVPRPTHPNAMIAALSNDIVTSVHPSTIDLWVARTIVLYAGAMANNLVPTSCTSSSPTPFHKSKL